MRTLVVVCLLLAVACASHLEDSLPTMWSDFKGAYNRQYVSVAEEQKRYSIFQENMRRAAQLQEENPMATFGMNRFSDLAREEFASHHNGGLYFRLQQQKPRKPARAFDEATVERIAATATAVDWRTKGAVTPVKDQGQCGSCWSFSTTGNIEGQWFLGNNSLTSLSEQELVSCDTNDNGCNGGLMDNAFEWLIDNKGGRITTEASYPYVSGGGSVPACSTGKIHNDGAKISSYVDIEHSEKHMLAWLATNGPIAIAVDASTWQTYTGGILSQCSKEQIDHGVLLVGYGSSGFTRYWIIKNSWSSSWGENGYIRVKYGDNACLIKSYPTSATL